MADDYFSDTPISRPLNVGIEPDVDLNGMSFSYTIGLFFHKVPDQIPIKLPPPFQGNNL